MSIEQRDEQIAKLERALQTRVIAYLTGDRPTGMEAQIGSDVVPKFRRHLESIGEVQSIGLFLYSRGGDTNVPWRLVSLVREYCKELLVLVPFRAHSAATLICLGADRIIMGKMGELSAIDPSVANQFNPPDPSNPAARVPISVEDVNAFKDLARRFGVKETDPANAQIFLSLASKVDPLALGNVERHHNQIRKLATDLLNLRREVSEESRKKNETLVTMLIERLYSHSHQINRREAQRLGLEVEIASAELDGMLWALFADYAAEMELDRPFSPQQMLGPQSQSASVAFEAKRAFIESRSMTDAYLSSGSVNRVAPGAIQFPPGMQLPAGMQAQVQPVVIRMDFDGWKILRQPKPSEPRG